MLFSELDIRIVPLMTAAPRVDMVEASRPQAGQVQRQRFLCLDHGMILFRLVIMNLHLLGPIMPQHQAEIPLMTLSEFSEPPLYLRGAEF